MKLGTTPCPRARKRRCGIAHTTTFCSPSFSTRNLKARPIGSSRILAAWWVPPRSPVHRSRADDWMQYPHHPWKGWQEHHRIHKAKIDHLIEQLARGENIDVAPDE